MPSHGLGSSLQEIVISITYALWITVFPLLKEYRFHRCFSIPYLDSVSISIPTHIFLPRGSYSIWVVDQKKCQSRKTFNRFSHITDYAHLTHHYQLQVVENVVIHTSVNICMEKCTVLVRKNISCYYKKNPHIHNEDEVLFPPRKCSILTSSAEFTTYVISWGKESRKIP